MMSEKRIAMVIAAAIISLGVFGAGYSIGKNILLVKKMSRVVTVKGLAEQDVKSDLGIWEINYREIGNDLIQANQRLQHDQATVTEFLKSKGFADNEIESTQLKVEDKLANLYNQTSTNANEQRYVLTGGVRVRSNKVELIQQSAQQSDQLIQQGVPLAFDISSLSPNPSFYYTNLDSIRPRMLSEAIKSARLVALQIAKDSGFRLGNIQRANQGVFQIMNRDTSTMSSDWNSNQNALGTIDKQIRLVATLDYEIR